MSSIKNDPYINKCLNCNNEEVVCTCCNECGEDHPEHHICILHEGLLSIPFALGFSGADSISMGTIQHASHPYTCMLYIGDTYGILGCGFGASDVEAFNAAMDDKLERENA